MSESTPTFSETPGQWRLAYFAVLVVGAIAMGSICGHDFLWWDDHGTIHQNPYLNPPTAHSFYHFWTAPQWGLYMPVTTSVWGLIAFAAHVQPDRFDIALNPWFFHTASVMAHLIAAMLVVRILRLLNATPFAAACGAILFAVHPIQVETVAWASGLKDVLAGVFTFAAIVQYIHFAVAQEQEDRWVGRLVAATIFFELAMLSKASAITLPLLALVIDCWAIGRRWREACPVAIGWLILAIPIAIYAVIVQDAGNTPATPLLLKPLIACDSLAFYLYKLMWPISLCVDYGRTWRVVLQHGWLWWDWVLPLAVTLLLYRLRRRVPLLVAGALIFLIACSPTIGLNRTLYAYFTTVADHYLYVSMLGPALAIAWLLSIYQSAMLRFVCIVALALCCGRSVVQAAYWQNDITLFTRSIQVNPQSYVSYGNLGSAYAREDRLDDAIECFRKAIPISPRYSLSYSNLGHALAKAGDIDGAIENDQRSIDLQNEFSTLRPSWVRDNWQMGELLLRRRQYVRAEQYLLTAAESEPANKELLAMLAEAHHFAATQPATTQSAATAPATCPSPQR